MTTRKVISTRKIKPSLINEAMNRGVSIQVHELITIRHLNTTEKREESASIRRSPVVFTSRNAVAAVAELVEQRDTDSWQIFCLRGATANHIKKYFSSARIVGTAEDGVSLANVILSKEDPQHIIFFCGNRRRDELPCLLRKNGFQVKELVVYETVLTPAKIEENYQGVMFFSPSAVESFFSINKLATDVVCFSIGNTTTDALKKITTCPVITANEPSEEKLVELVLTNEWHTPVKTDKK